MCIGSDFNNIISSVVFAPKNVSIFPLKITWADLIKGTYIFHYLWWAACKLQLLIWVPNKLTRNREFLSMGEEQIWAGCSAISINGRLPGSWKSCPQSCRQQLEILSLCWVWGDREQLSCCSPSWHGQAPWEHPHFIE